MLRWMRFAVFALFLGSALAINARALRAALGLVFTPLCWAPAAPAVLPALALLGLAATYAVWLAGATVARWRMPTWTHAFPAAALILTLSLGPMPMSKEAFDGGPADRAVEAMRRLAQRLEARHGAPCEASPAELDRLLDEASPPGTGFRRFGRALGYKVEALGERDEPQRQTRAGDLPGTLYLACARSGRAFWLSAVVTDRIPRGEPAMALDGVGKAAVIEGESQ